MDVAVEVVVQTEGLSKRFPARQGGAVVAVDGLDVTIERGEVYGLVGPDGAGKTTTIRLLTGLMAPTGGHITVLGYEIPRQSWDVKRDIGYMAQAFRLYADLSVMENLRFFANAQGVSTEVQAYRIPRLLSFAGLTGIEGRLGGQLSGGMKKKLALACVLIHEPHIVFLDEPTQGVDPVSRREFWQLLAELRLERGTTVFLCTPYMDEAERCHRVGLMYEGRLVAQGKPREIRRLVPGQLLTCRPSDFEKAKALAPTVPGVLEMHTMGDRLNLFVDDATVREPQILKAMSDHDVTLDELRRSQPRMEEAFISLVQREEIRSEGELA